MLTDSPGCRPDSTDGFRMTCRFVIFFTRTIMSDGSLYCRPQSLDRMDTQLTGLEAEEGDPLNSLENIFAAIDLSQK